MGCDCHIIIQVFDPITKQYKFARESVSNSRKIQIDEHLTFTIYSPSTEKLALISSEELKNNLFIHKDCEDEKCDCQYDFHTEFHIKRDYALFGKIANVRYENEHENMQPRGLPEDADDLLKHMIYEYQDSIEYGKYGGPGDYHSHTYLSDHEIDNLSYDIYQNTWNNGGLKELKLLLNRVRDSFPVLESRFIIAFDN